MQTLTIQNGVVVVLELVILIEQLLDLCLVHVGSGRVLDSPQVVHSGSNERVPEYERCLDWMLYELEKRGLRVRWQGLVQFHGSIARGFERSKHRIRPGTIHKRQTWLSVGDPGTWGRTLCS